MTGPTTTPERAAPRHGGWRSRLARTLVISTMGVLALITLAPTLGRLAAAHLATRLLATPVQLAWLGLEFEPLTITASGVAIGPEEGPRAAAVRVGLDPSRLGRGELAPREIVVEGLRLHAEVGKHGFVVAGTTPELLGFTGAMPTTVRAARDVREDRVDMAPPVELRDARLVLRWPESALVTLDLRFDRLDLRDGTVEGLGQLSALGAQAPRTARITDLRWTPSPAGRFAAHLSGPDRAGRLGVEGRIDPASSSLDLALAFDALPATLLTSFVRPETLALPPRTGRITGATRVEVGPGQARIYGDLTARDLATASTRPDAPEEVLAVATAAATFGWEPGRLTVERLRLDWPYGMLARHAERFFPFAGSGGAASPGATTVTVRELTVAHGRVDYVDHTLEPSLWAGASDLGASGRDLDLASGAVGSLALTFRRDEILPSSVKLERTRGETEITLDLPGTSLASINPWIEPLLGYRATGGRLDLSGSGALRGREIEGELALDLQRARFEQTAADRVYDATGVPLPVALSLLADRAGVARIDLDLAGDLHRGEANLSPLVGRALLRAVAGALTSPLAVLGNLFGTGGAPDAFAIEPLPFPAGSARLDATGSARVTQISRLLAMHPELMLLYKPMLARSDEQALGAAALPRLAADRSAALAAAFTGAGLTPERLVSATWTAADPPSKAPGGYVELRPVGPAPRDPRLTRTPLGSTAPGD